MFFGIGDAVKQLFGALDKLKTFFHCLENHKVIQFLVKRQIKFITFFLLGRYTKKC